MSRIEKVIWDSDFFGFLVGRIKIDNEMQWLQQVADAITKDHYSLLYIISDRSIDKEMEQMGYSFYHDIKITFEKKLSFGVHSIDEKIFDAKEKLEYLNEIIELGVHAGIFSRYFLDPNFPHDQFKKLYIEWIKKSLDGKLADKVFVHCNDHISGLITLKKQCGEMEIGLIAVSQKDQSLGIGAKLLKGAETFAESRNCSSILVSTQEINEKATAFYLKNGYIEKSRKHIYHLWA